MKFTVSETAKMFKVSGPAVRKWLRDGLKYETEKVIGIKTRIKIDPVDVEAYHKNKTL